MSSQLSVPEGNSKFEILSKYFAENKKQINTSGYYLKNQILSLQEDTLICSFRLSLIISWNFEISLSVEVNKGLQWGNVKQKPFW